jgi:hypothetical protein
MQVTALVARTAELDYSFFGQSSSKRFEGLPMKRALALMLACLFAFDFVAYAGLGSDKTAYVGGTENQIKDGAEGTSSAKDDKRFVFEYKGGKLEIPYDEVNDLEYGQKAGRRLELALVISPWLLLSKKRKHFLTIGWKDEQDGQHAAVLELGKSIVRTILATLEARTGKKIEYQDDEARKSGLGGS